MAVWKQDNCTDDTVFDDGLKFKPGEAGFTSDVAAKHFAGQKFSYKGTPNWAPPAEPTPAPAAPAA